MSSTQETNSGNKYTIRVLSFTKSLFSGVGIGFFLKQATEGLAKLPLKIAIYWGAAHLLAIGYAISRLSRKQLTYIFRGFFMHKREVDPSEGAQPYGGMSTRAYDSGHPGGVSTGVLEHVRKFQHNAKRARAYSSPEPRSLRKFIVKLIVALKQVHDDNKLSNTRASLSSEDLLDLLREKLDIMREEKQQQRNSAPPVVFSFVTDRSSLEGVGDKPPARVSSPQAVQQRATVFEFD